MLRLRELAGATALAMLGMGAMMSAPFLSSVQVSFRPAVAMDTIRIASTQANDALRLAFGTKRAEAATQAPLPPIAPIHIAATDPAFDQTIDAADRLRRKIPSELYPYFDVYLYVSKAAAGSLAQHMYIFHKSPSGALVFEETFPVSTGREQYERYFTTTPVGLFELDPNRFEVSHYSRTWRAHMPWAMFLNATINGKQTGVALHSAGSHEPDLGHRASGGCVRLPHAKAAELFHRFQAENRGMVPIFSYDSSRRRTSGDGNILHDASGNPILQPGYRVLLFIENYEGSGPALVAVVT
ncbi:MAG: L,D-transpeptidase [Alphaproteobacteria bacterium]|nr:L,D-transpeptidase [Alphaproteobacteria bacterium]MBV9542491.1 L,D-transpeptidase [Alphaproteobacteria bacterium]MBV9903501.1 L,D-transpeptidase [Alphaproteobacteria bacterium]